METRWIPEIPCDPMDEGVCGPGAESRGESYVEGIRASHWSSSGPTPKPGAHLLPRE